MTTVRSVRLVADSVSGGKFYVIRINEAPRMADGRQLYTVDFEYGALNATPRKGTKTNVPVSLTMANVIFDRLQADKERGDSHYNVVDRHERVRHAPPPIPEVPLARERRQDFAVPPINRPDLAITGPPRNRQERGLLIERAIRMYREGNSVAQIAREIRMPAATVWSWCRPADAPFSVPEDEARTAPRSAPTPAPTRAPTVAPTPAPTLAAQNASEIHAAVRGVRRIRLAPKENT